MLRRLLRNTGDHITRVASQRIVRDDQSNFSKDRQRWPKQLLRGSVSGRSPCGYFMIIRSCCDALLVLSFPFCSTVPLCVNWSAADTQLRLSVRVVSLASVLSSSVLECYLSPPGSLAILCILYKINSNHIHPFCGALPRCDFCDSSVTRGTLFVHRYTYAPPPCRTSQCSRTFIPNSVSP